MKTLIKDIALKLILDRKNLTNCNQLEVLMMDNGNKGSKNKAGLKNRVGLVFKKTFILLGISPDDANTEKPNSNDYIYYNISNEIDISQLSNSVLFEGQIIKTFLVDFEDKYTIPFLLYSLGYTYEEIASILELSTGMVKSRIFYFQKKMQELLIEMSNTIT